MNASDFDQGAENQIPPTSADQPEQDDQAQGQQPQDSAAQESAPQENGPQDMPPPYDSQRSYEPHYDHAAFGDPPLYRPVHDRMIAGVAAGIAQYLNIDVTVVRIVLVVLAFVGGAGLPVYLAGWLLIPDEGHGQSVASELIGSLQGHWS
jgi:phage shock protein PspC (stress-responsive transcriptional regulator)